ncbi:MAG: hypothetical protein HN919_17100 [Verrucomicrobia bacterium]|jgi:hypothetical protein|nr:hypothetical protein [Verrucomicrobiota bacterium]
MRKQFVVLAAALAVGVIGCARNPTQTFQPSAFGWSFTAERLLGRPLTTEGSFRVVRSDQWFIRVFDFEVAVADAPALFAKWKDEIEGDLRSSGTKMSPNRAQPPNLELIYWPSDQLTGTLHLFLTPLPDGKARVTAVVYECGKDG